jgi:hypothetical protein
MLASFPASMVNQMPTDLGIPNRFKLTPSRFSAFCARDHRCRRLIASLPVAFLLCHITVVAAANRPDERTDIRDHSHIAPDIAALIRATR